MEMRTRDAPRRPHAPDDLAARDGIAHDYGCTAQVVVSGRQPVTVIHVHGDPAVVPVSDHRDDAAVRHAHRRALGPRQVEPRVFASEDSVHPALDTEPARYVTGSGPRPDERLGPEPRDFVRAPRHVAPQLAFRRDALCLRAVRRIDKPLRGDDALHRADAARYRDLDLSRVDDP